MPFHDTLDQQLHDFVWNHISCGGSVNEVLAEDVHFKAICDYLANRRDDPPDDLIRNLFSAAPSAALLRLTMQWHDGSDSEKKAYWTDIARVEHQVQDVVWKHDMGLVKPEEEQAVEAELDRLSKFNEWWVRLYVAQMLYRHDDIFDAPAARERLQRDSNPLIAEAINTVNHHGMTETEEREAWNRLGYPNGRPSTAPLKRIRGN